MVGCKIAKKDFCFSKMILPVSILFFIFLFFISFSLPAFASTGIVINKSQVTINTTYRSDGDLMAYFGYPKIFLLSLKNSSSNNLINNSYNDSSDDSSSSDYVLSSIVKVPVSSVQTATVCPRNPLGSRISSNSSNSSGSSNSSSIVSCSFISRATLGSGSYSYVIMVHDSAGNERTDEKNFTISLPIGALDESCYNNLTDGLETDRNCGGSCLCCEVLKVCKNNSDCCSGFCRGGFCSEPRCDDKLMNGFESDVDCGGSCPLCVDGKKCSSDSDCESGFCNSNKICALPSCDDNFKNALETDVDCGGVNCSKCSNGESCIGDSDCESDYCESGFCSCDMAIDSDEDGMPDCWEIRYNLDPFDSSDAKKDYDRDGKSNLDEYLDDSDPTDPTDNEQEKSHLLGIILLIIGLLLVIGSTSFLVYSRKVLVPDAKLKSLSQKSGVQNQNMRSSIAGQSSNSAVNLNRAGTNVNTNVNNKNSVSGSSGKSSVAEALAKRRLSKGLSNDSNKSGLVSSSVSLGSSVSVSSGSSNLSSSVFVKKDTVKTDENDGFILLEDLDKKDSSSQSGSKSSSQPKLSAVFDKLKEGISSLKGEKKEKGKEEKDSSIKNDAVDKNNVEKKEKKSDK